MYSLQLPIPAVVSNHHIINKPLSLSSSLDSCKINNSSPLAPRLATRHKCGVSGSEKIEMEMGAAAAAAGGGSELADMMMPKHVAVIMDGNRRWAIDKGLPPQHGHRAGVKAMSELVRNCYKHGVKVVTVFASSTENWIRPQEEVKFANNLFQEIIISGADKLMQKDVRLSFLGSRGRLPERLQEIMLDAEERTKENKRMQFVVALNYGGRSEITEATKKIATKVKDGVLQVEDVDDAVFQQHLGTTVIDEFPNPDLMIRSSGELRVSNFLLWQLAYTEMFFTKKLFPDFDETDFNEAVAAFQRRQRRFGGHKH